MLIKINKISNPKTNEKNFQYLCKRISDNYWVEINPNYCSECLNFADCPISDDDFILKVESNPNCEICGSKIDSEGYLYIIHQLRKSNLFDGKIMCCRCFNERNL